MFLPEYKCLKYVLVVPFDLSTRNTVCVHKAIPLGQLLYSLMRPRAMQYNTCMMTSLLV